MTNSPSCLCTDESLVSPTGDVLHLLWATFLITPWKVIAVHGDFSNGEQAAGGRCPAVIDRQPAGRQTYTVAVDRGEAPMGQLRCDPRLVQFAPSLISALQGVSPLRALTHAAIVAFFSFTPAYAEEIRVLSQNFETNLNFRQTNDPAGYRPATDRSANRPRPLRPHWPDRGASQQRRCLPAGCGGRPGRARRLLGHGHFGHRPPCGDAGRKGRHDWAGSNGHDPPREHSTGRPSYARTSDHRPEDAMFDPRAPDSGDFPGS